MFLPLNALASSEAQDALTKAVMKIPLVNDSRKEIEYKVRGSDFKYMFYFVPIASKTVKFNHPGVTYQYELDEQRLDILYKIEF